MPQPQAATTHVPPGTPTLGQAIALHRAGRSAEAAQMYEALLAADPRLPVARHNLGLLRFGQGNFAAALTLLETAYAEDGQNAGWLPNLANIGLALYSQGCWEDARPWLERAAARLAADAPARSEVLAALERVRPRTYLAPEVWDPLQQRSLLRGAPREAPTYVYAIDVVGTCNLRCPTCPVGNFPAAERPKGFMAVAMFERILAKIAAERVAERPQIWLFNWGEPLLHPELATLIGLVKSHGFACHLSTNLNVERGLRELARAAPDDLKISLSGFTPQDYARTHARGRLMLVKANMYLLRHYLDRYHAATRVWVGHHLYKGTEGQVPQVRALCDELGFEHHPMPAFYMPLERLLDVVQGRGPPDPTLDLLLEHPRDSIPRSRRERSERHDCELRFNQTVINHDGTVALCCTVYERANMLGMSFLDTPHAEIERAKYRHPFCATCMANGLSYPVRDARRITG